MILIPSHAETPFPPFRPTTVVGEGFEGTSEDGRGEREVQVGRIRQWGVGTSLVVPRHKVAPGTGGNAWRGCC